MDIICANIGLKIDNTGLEFTFDSAVRVVSKFVGTPAYIAAMQADDEGNERALFCAWLVGNTNSVEAIEKRLELLAIAMQQTAIAAAYCNEEGDEIGGELIGINSQAWGEYNADYFRWPDADGKGRAVAAELN